MCALSCTAEASEPYLVGGRGICDKVGTLFMIMDTVDKKILIERGHLRLPAFD